MSPNTKIIQSDTARSRQAVRNLDAMPWAPRATINWRALGWAFVTLIILAGLMGLLTIGAR